MDARESGAKRTSRSSVVLGALIVVALCGGAEAGDAAQGGIADEARQPPAAAMDAYMRRIVATEDFSGAVIVAKRGRVLFSRGYGLANRETRRPNTPETVFRVPGMLVFNEIAAYQLRDDQRLEFEASVCKYVPRCPAGWHPISVSALLEGVSGLPNLWLFRDQRRAPSNIATAVAWMKRQPLLFSAAKPGRRRDTSPGPQVLLSYLIGRVSGLGWPGYLQTRVLDPAGLHETTLSPAPARRGVGYLLPGFRQGRDVEFTKPDPVHGIWTTVGDLLKLDNALYDDELLSATSREELFPAAAHSVAGMHGYDRVQGRVRDGWYSVFGHHAPDGIFVGLLINARKAQYRFYEMELALAAIAARGRSSPRRPVQLPPPPTITFSGELGAVTVSSADGTARVALTGPYAGYGTPVAWSGDGRRLLFNRWKGDRADAFAIDASGRNERRLSRGQALSWAPDGRAVVASAGEVWFVSADGRSRSRATAPGVADARADLAYSPDGRHVLWTRIGRLRGARTTSQLLLTDLGSGKSRPLRREMGFYRITAGAWSPDGTQIAFSRRARLGSFEGGTYVTDADGGNLRRIATDAGSGPAWSHDGLKLAYNVGISCRIRLLTVASLESATLPFEGCAPIWRND